MIKKALRKLKIQRPIYVVKEIIFDGDNLKDMKIAKVYKGNIIAMLDFKTFKNEAKDLLDNPRKCPELEYFFSELSTDDFIKLMKYIDKYGSPERR